MNEESLKRGSVPHSLTASIALPKPLDFDAFIPWICREFEVPYEVVVIRTVQEDYIPCIKTHTVSSKSKSSKQSTKTKTGSDINIDIARKESKEVEANVSSVANLHNCVRVTAYYNTKGHLAEIAVIGSPFEIPRKLIIAFSLCVPFHPSLGKITIRKRGLKMPALYEISKLLSRSNITDVFIEDCFVPEGSYYLLLDLASNLKNLALRRLCLNNEACVNIAKRLDIGKPASKSLLTLDLSFNKIGDEGAIFLGEVLRKNRSLFHLNLCDNLISDNGAEIILSSLKLFPLSFEEIRKKKMRRFEYYVRKMELFKKHFYNLNFPDEGKNANEIIMIKDHKKGKKSKPSATASELSITQQAEKMTMDEMGEFNDVFAVDNVRCINKNIYCNGNFSLCSLNLSYNNISYLTLRKIREVLLYQRNFLGTLNHTQGRGLLRVFFEGNNIPTDCEEIRDIQDLTTVTHHNKHTRLSLTRTHSSNVISIKSFKSSKVKKHDFVEKLI